MVRDLTPPAVIPRASIGRAPSWVRLSWRRLIALIFAGLFLVSAVWPDHPAIPVAGAHRADWNPRSFWAHPWGASGVHKGIDIFAPQGTTIRAATSGVVLFAGNYGPGGNIVVILGPRWRIHYYAHLREIGAEQWQFANKGDGIGTVGTTGNAAGKPPHLHYTIVTLIPYPWRADSDPQGWKKMFYLDPGALLTE